MPPLAPFAAQSGLPKRLGERGAARYHRPTNSHQWRHPMRMTKGLAKLLAAAALLALPCGAASAQVTLKAVMHSDLKIVDPIWTTAYITRNHGYMVYDTLFAMDDKGEIKPQML